MNSKIWSKNNLLQETSYENRKYKKTIYDKYAIDIQKNSTVHHLGNIQNDITRVVFIHADTSTANFFHQLLHQISKKHLQLNISGEDIPPIYYADIYGGFQRISFQKLVNFSYNYNLDAADSLTPQQIYNELI